MTAQLRRILDFNIVKFDKPSESHEQECVFVSVETSKNTIKDGVQIAKVTGKIHVYAPANKLPYGYFSKKINEADLADTAPYFFYDFEHNTDQYFDIDERIMSFVYFFNSQYNPALGTITSVAYTGD